MARSVKVKSNFTEVDFSAYISATPQTDKAPQTGIFSSFPEVVIS